MILVLKMSQKFQNKCSISVWAVFGIALMGFLYSWGQWPLVGSYYLRFYPVLVIIVILWNTGSHLRKSLSNFPIKQSTYLFLVPILILSVFIIVLDLRMMIDNNYPSQSINLEFPLRNGKYYIGSAGSNKLINNHFRNYPNSQQYALDINKLGSFGNAYKSFFSRKPSNHYIFSDTIYSPCSGMIITTIDNVDDNTEATMMVDSESGKGNYITLDCNGVHVSMYHLKKDGVFIQVNSYVEVGDPIGMVGNSGFSQEPHLHIQASTMNKDSIREGIPILFGNKYLKRNDLIDAR